MCVFPSHWNDHEHTRLKELQLYCAGSNIPGYLQNNVNVKPWIQLSCLLWVYYHSATCVDNSIQVYLSSAFHDTSHCKAALQKMLSFYIILMSRLLVVTMPEMYSKIMQLVINVIEQTFDIVERNVTSRRTTVLLTEYKHTTIEV